jgi:hypothetical protein
MKIALSGTIMRTSSKSRGSKATGVRSLELMLREFVRQNWPRLPLTREWELVEAVGKREVDLLAKYKTKPS